MKPKPIKELQNLSKKDKKALFGLCFQKLSIDCHYLNTLWMNPTQCEGYNGITPHVSFEEERIQTLFGCSNDIMKDSIQGFNLHSPKFIVSYFKKLEVSREKRRIKEYTDRIKQLKKVKEDVSEMIEYEEKMLALPPNRIPLFYCASITDYTLTEYGMRPGASLGGEWHAFTIVKYKGRYEYTGAMDSMMLMDAVTKQIQYNSISTLSDIEAAMANSMVEFYQNNPHIKKQFV